MEDLKLAYFIKENLAKHYFLLSNVVILSSKYAKWRMIAPTSTPCISNEAV